MKGMSAELAHIKTAANMQVRLGSGALGRWCYAGWRQLCHACLNCGTAKGKRTSAACSAPLPIPLRQPPLCLLPQLAGIKGLIGEVRLGLRQINTEVVQVRGRWRVVVWLQ